MLPARMCEYSSCVRAGPTVLLRGGAAGEIYQVRSSTVLYGRVAGAMAAESGWRGNSENLRWEAEVIGSWRNGLKMQLYAATSVQ